MQAQRVAKTSEIQNLDTFRAALLPVLDDIEAERRREFLHRNGVFRTNTIRPCNESPRSRRHTESRHLRNLHGGLPHNLRVQRSARRLDSSLELDFFLRAANMRALLSQFFQYTGFDGLIHNDRLLTRT